MPIFKIASSRGLRIGSGIFVFCGVCQVDVSSAKEGWDMDNAFADFDYEREGQEFLAELSTGKYGGKFGNNWKGAQEKEDFDNGGFEYLNSESFKALDKEASQ